MIIDLHVHTNPKSPCSSILPKNAIEEARKIGLDGICFVEHDILWDEQEITNLIEETGFKIFRGYEISSLDGHFLAYGFPSVVEPFLTIQEIRVSLGTQDGFLAVAHPFREFLVVGIKQIAASPEEEARKELFKNLNGIEVLNGRVSKQANKFARKVNSILKLKELGGSDAHELHEIGKTVTVFRDEIRTESELIQALKNSEFEVKYFRDT